MATLAESFLADLDELSDASDVEEQPQQEEEDDEMLGADVEELNYDDLSAVAHLAGSERYRTTMAQVSAAIEQSQEAEGQAGEAQPPEGQAWTGPSEEDPTYRLLVDCNQLAVDIDNEIAVVHNFTRDRYRLKFPELESLVQHPIDYARVVQRIGNQDDITLVNLDDILPQAQIMVVSVTASTTSGQPLSSEDLVKVNTACELALQLDADKAKIHELVKRKMHHIAPNLSIAVGTEVAAKLMGVAGGLVNLSQMPACNVQVLGAKRRTLAGFSTATQQPHQGFIAGCEVVQETPPGLRGRAARLVGAKTALLARIDAYGKDPSGRAGQHMKDEMRKKIEKWQEPPPAKQTKVLPVPDMEPKKRRGGRRFRKQKERYALTDTRKAQNRMRFNEAEEEYMDGEDVVGLGVLGREGIGGRLRLQTQKQRQKLSAKTAKKYRAVGGSSGATSGMSSSLAFTPVQGIELTNPSALFGHDTDKKDGTESYFSEYSGFRSSKKT